MNTTTRLIAALSLSLAAAGAAWAQEAQYEMPQPITSQTTRAAVLADLQLSRASGSVVINEAYVGVLPSAVASPVSRAAVHAETLAALASGQVAALTAEPSAFAPMLRPSVTATLVAAR